MNFGLICATFKEAEVIVKDRQIQFTQEIQGYYFCKVEFERFNIIIAISNIGPENAVKCCSILVKYFSIDCIINFGTCGAINPDIEKGSLILPNRLVFIGNSNQEIGHTRLANRAQQTLQFICSISTCEENPRGTIVSESILASSTVFVTSNIKQSMVGLGIAAVDMESFALAVTCNQNNDMPIAIIKVVVDTLEANIYNIENYLIEESKTLNFYGEFPREIVWRYLNLYTDKYCDEKCNEI